MHNWLIVILNIVVLLECYSIAMWYAMYLRDWRLNIMAGGFITFGVGYFIFVFVRDLIFALGYTEDATWWFHRDFVILPWRIVMVVAFGAILGVLRFGNWSNGK